VPGACSCRASRHPKLVSSKNDMKHPTGLQLTTIDEQYQMNPYPIVVWNRFEWWAGQRFGTGCSASSARSS
jgi:hypothetical protein